MHKGASSTENDLTQEMDEVHIPRRARAEMPGEPTVVRGTLPSNFGRTSTRSGIGDTTPAPAPVSAPLPAPGARSVSGVRTTQSVPVGAQPDPARRPSQPPSATPPPAAPLGAQPEPRPAPRPAAAPAPRPLAPQHAQPSPAAAAHAPHRASPASAEPAAPPMSHVRRAPPASGLRAALRRGPSFGTWVIACCVGVVAGLVARILWP